MHLTIIQFSGEGSGFYFTLLLDAAYFSYEKTFFNPKIFCLIWWKCPFDGSNTWIPKRTKEQLRARDLKLKCCLIFLIFLNQTSCRCRLRLNIVKQKWCCQKCSKCVLLNASMVDKTCTYNIVSFSELKWNTRK